ncbi:hypothetical protein KFE25_014072 [Diacronema lutheri]|uniref:DNA replication complex GINS protein PSF3 n=1 Tax=Diacronema lutheri TaxID=2081491 RepID=A0A8J6C748_DIALT|nr:hypothetical protein KFE25_014072 [Diacronema lutheri]
MSAFDQMVDDLLAEEEKVPCEFLHESHHLGWLDDDGDGDMLASGAKIELPVYLASELLRGNHVDVLTPQCFGPQTRNALKADPDVVNLRDKNEFFFAHGLRVAELTPDDEGLPKVLADAFEARYRRMLDTCLTGSDGDPGGLTHRLSSTESKLFRTGLAGQRDYQRWKAGQAGRITACDMIRHARKRQRCAPLGQSSTPA